MNLLDLRGYVEGSAHHATELRGSRMTGTSPPALAALLPCNIAVVRYACLQLASTLRSNALAVRAVQNAGMLVHVIFGWDVAGKVRGSSLNRTKIEGKRAQEKSTGLAVHMHEAWMPPVWCGAEN